MKRKIYFQNSTIAYSLIFLFLAVLAAVIYVITDMIIKILNGEIGEATAFYWVAVVIAILVGLFIFYTLIKFVKNIIVIRKDEVFVSEHWGSKERKLQYETHINYKEIQDIYFISSNNNSLNQPLKWGVLAMPYIVFECKNSKQRAINVFFYTKKQCVKLINEVIKRSESLGNHFTLKTGEEILNDFIDKRNR